MATTLTIEPDERAQLEQLARTTTDKKTADRVRIILALADGYHALEVAHIFRIDQSTVNKWRNKFSKRRLLTDWLSTDNSGYSGKLTCDQERQISSFVEASTITDCKQLVSYISDNFNISYTATGVTKLLHRLGFVYKQTTLVPGKLDEVAQAAWLKKYRKLEAKLKDKDDEVILFGDGVHPSHNVHATKAWIRKGTQKLIPTNTGRDRLNINGVLNLKDMSTVVHFAKTLNAETTIELFDKVQEAYPDKRKIHLVVDNARYYKNKLLQAYLHKRKCRIKIIWLPPYSPNLNFIERLWHFLKKYIIGSKRRQKFKEFEDDVKHFFEHMSDYQARLRQFIGTELHLLKAA